MQNIIILYRSALFLGVLSLFSALASSETDADPVSESPTKALPYDLIDAISPVKNHRFKHHLDDTSSQYFSEKYTICEAVFRTSLEWPLSYHQPDRCLQSGGLLSSYCRRSFEWLDAFKELTFEQKATDLFLVSAGECYLNTRTSSRHQSVILSAKDFCRKRSGPQCDRLLQLLEKGLNALSVKTVGQQFYKLLVSLYENPAATHISLALVTITVGIAISYSCR